MATTSFATMLRIICCYAEPVFVSAHRHCSWWRMCIHWQTRWRAKCGYKEPERVVSGTLTPRFSAILENDNQVRPQLSLQGL